MTDTNNTNINDLFYETKLETARECIKMMKEDHGFSTFWTLEEIAERLDIFYEDIMDLENEPVD